MARDRGGRLRITAIGWLFFCCGCVRQKLADSVEKVPSLMSFKICQNTIDIFD